MGTIRGTIWSHSIQLMLALLLLLLLRLKLVLCHLSLFVKGLLSLNGREKVMSLQVFGVIMAHALLLHLPIFLWDVLDECPSRIAKGAGRRRDKGRRKHFT